jgi:hypothetical protein
MAPGVPLLLGPLLLPLRFSLFVKNLLPIVRQKAGVLLPDAAGEEGGLNRSMQN